MSNLITWKESYGNRFAGYCGSVQVANIHPDRCEPGTLCLNIEIPFSTHKGAFTNVEEAMVEAERVVSDFKHSAGW